MDVSYKMMVNKFGNAIVDYNFLKYREHETEQSYHINEMIGKLYDLSLNFEDFIKEWSKNLSKEEQEKLTGELLKISQNKYHSKHFENHIIEPIVKWLYQRKILFNYGIYLAFDIHQQFYIKGLRYMMQFISTVNYFIEIIKTKYEKYKHIIQLVDQCINILFDCPDNNKLYNFKKEFQKFISSLQEKNKYENFIRIFENLCNQFKL